MLESSPDAAGQNQSQRTYLALGVVALLSLVLGVWQLKTSIKTPFLPGSSLVAGNNADNSEILAGETSQEIKALQTKDTDTDGLSDYDELYVYHTSPYLKDTDSDGYEDKTEISSGNNPNCASGQTCLDLVAASDGNNVSAPAGPSTVPSSAEIRALLKKNGLSDEVLAKYDDATLVQMYREVAGETPNASPSAITPTIPIDKTVTLTAEQKALIAKMSASELREFFIQGGADKATLDKLDDATLKVLVNQVIEQ